MVANLHIHWGHRVFDSTRESSPSVITSAKLTCYLFCEVCGWNSCYSRLLWHSDGFYLFSRKIHMRNTFICLHSLFVAVVENHYKFSDLKQYYLSCSYGFIEFSWPVITWDLSSVCSPQNWREPSEGPTGMDLQGSFSLLRSSPSLMSQCSSMWLLCPAELLFNC